MKKLILYLLFLLLASNGFSYGNEGKSETVSNSSILFVGIKDYNLWSNYYTDDQIAENFKVKKEEVVDFFNQMFYQAFNDVASKKGFQLTTSGESVEVVCNNLIFDSKNDIVYSNISGINEKEYKTMLSELNTTLMLVLDQYYVKKEGYPYDNFSHILHYSVYDSSRNKVYDGNYQYVALDLGNSAMIQKQMRKAAGIFIKNILKK